MRSSRQLASAASLGVLLTLVALPAHAQDTIELGWEAPPGCPQEAAVRERLRALRGQPLNKGGRLRAEGRIEHVDGRYRLTLTVREGDAVRQRTMDADSCSDLAGAAAVALGLLIRNEHAGATEGAAGTGTAAERDASSSVSGSDARENAEANGAHANGSENRAPSAAAATAKPKSPNERRNDADEDKTSKSGESSGTSGEPRRWHILLRAPIGVLAIGRTSKPSGGVGAGVGFAYDAWRFAVSGRVFASQTLSSGDAYGTSVRVGRRELELGACRDWRSDRVALAPCFGAALERVTARGSGADVTPQTSSNLSVAITGGAEAQFFAFDWLSLVAGVALGVETSRPNFQINEVGDVKKLGPVEASFSVGSQWIF